MIIITKFHTQTHIDTQWRWTLLTFGLSFILSWLFFAVIWWLIAFTHGDLEFSHLPDNQCAYKLTQYNNNCVCQLCIIIMIYDFS